MFNTRKFVEELKAKYHRFKWKYRTFEDPVIVNCEECDWEKESTEQGYIYACGMHEHTIFTVEAK